MAEALQQIPFDLGARRAMGRDDFHIGPSNCDAVAQVDVWPDWSAPALIIHGPAASGKSHIAAVWQEKSGAQNVPAEMLLSRSAQQIADSGEHILLDGVDPWLGARAAETTLFHLYNILKEEQRSMLLTMRMAPSHAEFAIADLASRLRAAANARIDAPDDILLGSVLIKLFSDRQLNVSNDVIKYVLPRMERSFASAHEIVCKADQLALSRKKAVSVRLLRDVLAGLQN